MRAVELRLKPGQNEETIVSVLLARGARSRTGRRVWPGQPSGRHNK